MKTIFLLIAVFFGSLAVTGCTNDEGDNDIDLITPTDDEATVNETDTGYNDQKN
ncbi:hypothetical protein [Allomuricauda sp. SCSIO 65647]|uniref:hypothetical protein n=1 Tax=Allomuricauda sp. SCSIO 65647 TaxID=2908843 RepID=UPI001F1DAC29|nr:hypothetical protein [Muricauda sp. SCSIO 65647]UJH66621.1 hypothetical protein L0P89_11680 [Muricauda sp. SCSIO 65647]